MDFGYKLNTIGQIPFISLTVYQYSSFCQSFISDKITVFLRWPYAIEFYLEHFWSFTLEQVYKCLFQLPLTQLKGITRTDVSFQTGGWLAQKTVCFCKSKWRLQTKSMTGQYWNQEHWQILKRSFLLQSGTMPLAMPLDNYQRNWGLSLYFDKWEEIISITNYSMYCIYTFKLFCDSILFFKSLILFIVTLFSFMAS